MKKNILFICLILSTITSCKENIEVKKYSNGIVKSEVFIDKEGKPHGEGTFYDSLGNIELKMNYIHGFVNGWACKYYNNGMYDSSFFVNDTIIIRRIFNKNGKLVTFCKNETTCCFYQYYENGNIYNKYYCTDIKNKEGKWVESITDSLFVYRKNGMLLSSTKAKGDTLIIEVEGLPFKSHRSNVEKLVQINKYRRGLLGLDTCEIEGAKCK